MTRMDAAQSIAEIIEADSSDRDVQLLVLEWTTQVLVTHMWDKMVEKAEACWQKLHDGNHHVNRHYVYNDLDCHAFEVKFKRDGFRGFAHFDQNRFVLIVLQEEHYGTRIFGFKVTNHKDLWRVVKSINQQSAYFDVRDEGFLGGSTDTLDAHSVKTLPHITKDTRPTAFYTGNVHLAKWAMFDVDTLYTAIVLGEG